MHNFPTYRRALLGGSIVLACGLLLVGCRGDMTVPEQPPQPRTDDTTTRMSAEGWQTFGNVASIPISADTAPVQISTVVADPAAWRSDGALS